VATSSPQGWIWWVVAGVALGALLLWHSVRAMVRTLPVEVRSDLRQAVRTHPRLAATSGVVIAWTAVFALYSLSLSPIVDLASAGDRPAVAAPANDGDGGTPAPTPEIPSGPLGPTELAGPSFDDPAPAGDDDTAAAPTTETPVVPEEPVEPTPPDAEPGEPPLTCSTDSLAAAVEDAQAAAEALTGAPVGADLSLLIDAAGGCADPTTAVLAMLGPVAQLVNLLPLPPSIGLPAPPPLAVPRVPEFIAGPLRPYVFEACAEVSRQLVTVIVVAVVVHIDNEDLTEMFKTLDTVCGAFAPAPGGGGGS
jgi:hypothetical protein